MVVKSNIIKDKLKKPHAPTIIVDKPKKRAQYVEAKIKKVDSKYKFFDSKPKIVDPKPKFTETKPKFA